MNLDEALHRSVIAMKVRRAELTLKLHDPVNHHTKPDIDRDITKYDEAITVMEESFPGALKRARGD